jgi:DNA-binding MarR family transcriptional regulator
MLYGARLWNSGLPSLSSPSISVNVSSGNAVPPGGTAARASPLFLRDEELDRALELLLLAGRGLSARRAPPGVAEGLGETELELLWLVCRRPGTSAAELGRLLGTTKQSTSRHLQALEAAGLVSRGADETDRRRRALHATEAGAALAAAVAERRRLALRRAFQKAGPEAVAGFQRVLGELVEGLGRKPAARPVVREALRADG